MMSFINHTRDGQRQPATTPSLLAACIAMALMPTVSFAATTSTEDTVVVDGGFDNAQDPSAGQEQDYSVKTTTTGTKLLSCRAIFRNPSV
jgi:outer membrane receptor for ferric coprogen and ferric-rhodotorulic acid